MADVDEIIDFIKSLKKGFDKDLFQNKIDELAYTVDTTGLLYSDFHTLFKVWLNLSIPITKWINFGACLVPQDNVETQTVEYSLRWILANYENQTSFPRIGFLLDWLTAAMECECVDMIALDLGYEVFYTMLTFEVLTVHAMKLIYTLTKPADVTRRRVLELLDYARKREGKKNVYRQLQVLLGLFKSYKPECVPEDVPAISIHTAFKKLNVALLSRFKRCQERSHSLGKKRHYLLWVNPINSERGRNRKADPLVPNMEFSNIGSKQYADKKPLKNYLDFSEPVSLVQHAARRETARPARLRALLCNAAGLALLALAAPPDTAFLSHDLHHLLNSCFLEISPHSYVEKQDLVRRLAALQRALAQGLPVVTRFLAQFLLIWNEKDFFAEILELVEWVSVDCPDHLPHIVDPLTRIYHRAQPMEQCAILKSLTNMYTNLVYASTKKHQHFMDTSSSKSNYKLVLPDIASKISDLCQKALQVSPEDMRVLYSSVWSHERMAMSWCGGGGGGGGGDGGVRAVSPPAALALALPLLSVSAALIDKMAALMILYKKAITKAKSNKQRDEDAYTDQIQMLKCYTSDMLNCLYVEKALSGRKSGFMFEKLHPQLVSKLGNIMHDIDAKLSLRNHIAFAPYTYLQLEAIDHRDADNKLWFNTVIEQEFTNLRKFLKTAVPELR